MQKTQFTFVYHAKQGNAIAFKIKMHFLYSQNGLDVWRVSVYSRNPLERFFNLSVVQDGTIHLSNHYGFSALSEWSIKPTFDIALNLCPWLKPFNLVPHYSKSK